MKTEKESWTEKEKEIAIRKIYIYIYIYRERERIQSKDRKNEGKTEKNGNERKKIIVASPLFFNARKSHDF